VSQFVQFLARPQRIQTYFHIFTKLIERLCVLIKVYHIYVCKMVDTSAKVWNNV
jgi:hypothetical protein